MNRSFDLEDVDGYLNLLVRRWRGSRTSPAVVCGRIDHLHTIVGKAMKLARFVGRLWLRGSGYESGVGQMRRDPLYGATSIVWPQVVRHMQLAGLHSWKLCALVYQVADSSLMHVVQGLEVSSGQAYGAGF